jgi:hypothetical protein
MLKGKSTAIRLLVFAMEQIRSACKVLIVGLIHLFQAQVIYN